MCDYFLLISEIQENVLDKNIINMIINYMISMNTYYDNKCLDLNYHVKIIFKFLNRILYLLSCIFILMWDVLKNYLTFKFSNINNISNNYIY